MNLKDLRYRINDESGLSIIGYDPDSEYEHRNYDEGNEIEVDAYFLLRRNHPWGDKFEVGNKSRQSWMLGKSGNSYSLYYKWGSEFHRDVFRFLFANEKNIIRKHNLWKK